MAADSRIIDGQSIASALSLGLLGGAALVTTAWLTRKGPAILIPYGALVGGTLLYLRAGRVLPFRRRYAVALGAFLVATAVLLVWIVTIGNPEPTSRSLWPPATSLLATVGLGALLSAAVAHLSRPSRGETPQPR